VLPSATSKGPDGTFPFKSAPALLCFLTDTSVWILRLLAAICGWKETARVLPKSERNRHGIDVELVPPCSLVTLAVNFAMVCAAEWNGELVAHFAAECARLRKPEMVSLANLPATQGARLSRYEAKVVLVTIAARLDQREVVDALGLELANS
jgi:hypothetical protein